MIDLQLNETIIQSLTPSDENLLRFIYKNADNIPDMSVKTFAEQASCAPSSVVRFCKKIGYSGFSELKFAVRRENERTDTAITPAPHLVTFDSIKEDLFGAIRGTSSLINTDNTYRIAELLNSDLPVYLFYPGGITDNLQRYLEKRLMINGRPHVYQVHSSNMVSHLIKTLPHEAILVFISASGTWGRTVELAKEASLRNLTTVGITPYTNNEVASHCKYNMRFFTQNRENSGAEYTSRLCIYYVIDALIEFYINLKEGSKHE